jgi:hypothetical protein
MRVRPPPQAPFPNRTRKKTRHYWRALDWSASQLQCNGGLGRNRTGVRGFAVRCMTTLPPGHCLKDRDPHDRRFSIKQNPGGPRLCTNSGAGNETRTRDPDLGKVVLYQLSYSRIGAANGSRSDPGMNSLIRPGIAISTAANVASAPVGNDKAPICPGPCVQSGAGNETRTRDPDLGKVVLYQLSYSRNGARILVRESVSSSRPGHTRRSAHAAQGESPDAGLPGASPRSIGHAARR